MNNVWTPLEEQFIRENAGKVTDSVVAMQLSEITNRPITIESWRNKRQKMGLRKAHGRGVCRLVNQKTKKLAGKGDVSNA